MTDFLTFLCKLKQLENLSHVLYVNIILILENEVFNFQRLFSFYSSIQRHPKIQP